MAKVSRSSSSMPPLIERCMESYLLQNYLSVIWSRRFGEVEST
jgi:hypothetical protein